MRMLRVPSMLYLPLCVLMCTLHSVDTAVNGVWVQALTMYASKAVDQGTWWCWS